MLLNLILLSCILLSHQYQGMDNADYYFGSYQNCNNNERVEIVRYEWQSEIEDHAGAYY